NNHERLVLVSTDSHVGPSSSTLREYCPKSLLDTFDSFTAETRERVAAGVPFARGIPDDLAEEMRWHADDFLLNDPPQPIHNMDFDGVAAEVIFHGTGTHRQQLGYIPFVTSDDHGMRNTGKHIYNEWLRDFCSVEPRRLLGVAELPYGDIDKVVAEVAWAA